MISKEEKSIVVRMYNRIVAHESAKDLINNSLLITLIGMQDSKRYRALRDNALLISDAINNQSIKKLINNKICKEISTPKGLGITLTAYGVYIYEIEENIINKRSLIDYIEGKYFTFKEDSKKINEKETIIIATMLLSRSFNLNTCINLNKGSLHQDKWTEIINKTADFLIASKIVKESVGKMLFPSRKTGKKPIVQLMQKTDSLPRKKGVSGLFKAHGGRRYFLNILDEGSNIDKNMYITLLKIIFPKKNIADSIDFFDRLKDFQGSLYRTYKPYIVEDLSEEHALKNSFDDKIEDDFLYDYFIGS